MRGQPLGRSTAAGYSRWIKGKHHEVVESAVSVRGQSRSRHSQKGKQRQHDLKLRELRIQESVRFAKSSTPVTFASSPVQVRDEEVRVLLRI